MANTLWDKIEAKFTELKAQLTASNSAAPAADHSKTISDFRAQLDGFKTELDAKDDQISALTKSNAKLTADLATALAAITDFDAKVEAAASKRAGEIVAAAGHPPVAAPAKEAATEEKPKLTGFAKVKAAFAAQSQK